MRNKLFWEKRIALTVLGMVLVGGVLAGCGRTPAPVSGTSVSAEVVSGSELLMLAEDRNEAENVAEMYGIELVDYSYGVATFHTEEDPSAVIARGRENGWPALELNSMVYLDDPVDPDYGGIQINTDHGWADQPVQ